MFKLIDFFDYNLRHPSFFIFEIIVFICVVDIISILKSITMLSCHGLLMFSSVIIWLIIKVLFLMLCLILYGSFMILAQINPCFSLSCFSVEFIMNILFIEVVIFIVFLIFSYR